MSTGALLDLKVIDKFTLAGTEYQVSKPVGANGTVPQIAWIIRAEIVVARVAGFVRNEPKIIEKEAGLCWPEELDARATDIVARKWEAAGLARGAVSQA
jgi:hypothetical protein